MSEKLTIKNFGPIKDIEVEFRDTNIFIGDQGTGKSTLSKVYAIVYNFAYFDIFDINFEDHPDPNTLKFLRFLELFGVLNYLQSETEIKFDSSKFQFEFSGGVVKTKPPEFYRMPLSHLEEKAKDYFTYNYIPAERVFVSTLADAMFGLNELEVKLPSLFNRFGSKFSSARKEKVRREYNHLLGVDFSHINGVDSIITQDGKMFPLSDASSGMQGTIPLLVVFDSVIENLQLKKRGNRNSLLVIEEPELNLFPETQKKIINYIVSNILLYSGIETKLVINTHSPYILTAINNLMYAFRVGQNHMEEAHKIIDKKYWINPDNVSAYILNDSHNKIQWEDILDRHEGMVHTEKIDEVSRKLNEEFDLLQNIELGVKA